MNNIVAYENVAHIRFDFVIRVRPDATLTASLPVSRCWSELRRDIVWDSAAEFFGASTEKHVDSALNTDFVADFFHILPRDLAEGVMRGILASYEDCIPVDKALGVKPGMGCGKDNFRWVWNECRVLTALQDMKTQVGRYEEQDIVRCVDPLDTWCTKTFLQSAPNQSIGEVKKQEQCFSHT
jgi:hypothetical protein